MFTIYWIKYEKDNDKVMEDLFYTLDDDNARLIYRRNGYAFNKSIIDSLSGEDINIYTDDETMLTYAADYDESIHNFKVFLMDEYTNGKFIPLRERYENVRASQNLTKMYYIGLFESEEQ